MTHRLVVAAAICGAGLVCGVPAIVAFTSGISIALFID